MKHPSSSLPIAGMSHRPEPGFPGLEEKRRCIAALDFMETPPDLISILRKPEQPRRFVIELHPDFYEPTWPRQFYAGWMETEYRAARTTDIDNAASFMNREAAERVCKELVDVPGCSWGVCPSLIINSPFPTTVLN